MFFACCLKSETNRVENGARFSRYKLLTKRTWPNPRSGTVQSNTTVILNEFGLTEDCVNGKTKLFVRSPQTVFKLEEMRSAKIPEIVIFLQKVGYTSFFLTAIFCCLAVFI